jgi:hypothetical protein
MGLSPDAWAQIGSTLFNTGSQVYANQQNRRWALQDWERQNRFNSPIQQMQRFKEAGLNPNLIYKQSNESAPVRSTDFVAPQIQEGALEILGKSNAIQVQELNLESMRLRNQNQMLQNEVLKEQLPDLKQKPFLQNRVQEATYDTLQEGANLKRQERSQKDTINPLEAIKLKKQNDILDEQFIALSQSNEFNKLSRPIQLQIAKATRDNLGKIGTGLETKNQLQDFELRMRNTLDNLGIGSGFAQSIIKLLLSKLLP